MAHLPPIPRGNIGLGTFNNLRSTGRGAPAPDAFDKMRNDMAQQYLRQRAGIPQHVPASYLADLWHHTLDPHYEGAYLAANITPENVRDIVEALIDPALAWYSQLYYGTYGASNLHVPRTRDIPGIYKLLDKAVTDMYRRDAHLMICVNVLDEWLHLLAMSDARMPELHLTQESQNWVDLETHLRAIFVALTTQALPLLKAVTA